MDHSPVPATLAHWVAHKLYVGGADLGSRSESAIPLATLLGRHRITVIKDTLTELDPEARTLTGAGGQSYPYDELILALGAVTNYFGIQGLKEFSYDIKSIDGAERFK